MEQFYCLGVTQKGITVSENMLGHFHREITNCKTNEHESKFTFWDNKLLIYGLIRFKIVKRLNENSLGQRNVQTFIIRVIKFSEDPENFSAKPTQKTFLSLIANVYVITAQRRTQEVENSLCKFFTGL